MEETIYSLQMRSLDSAALARSVMMEEAATWVVSLQVGRILGANSLELRSKDHKN